MSVERDRVETFGRLENGLRDAGLGAQLATDDCLLRQRADGVALTWMTASIDCVSVTRRGRVRSAESACSQSRFPIRRSSATGAAYHQGTVWPWLIGPYVDAARSVGIPVDGVLDGSTPISATGASARSPR